MSLNDKVGSDDLAAWADRRINLSSELAQAYREQGNRLRTKLEKYIGDHPGFDLVKMLNSGSVPKGIALRTKSDMDVGVYIKRAAAPASNVDLVGWLSDRLREAYGDLVSPDQITSDNVSVRVAFRGSSIDVECVPILFDGEADNYGDLLLRTGVRVRTSISKHLDFFRVRKSRHPQSFAQWVRFLRYWRNQRDEEGRMPLSGFAIDLIAAHLVDEGLDPSNYPAALQNFFGFIVKGGLEQRIVFTDNYAASKVIDDGAAIRIIDPVAETNNIASNISKTQRDVAVDAAAEALDDLAIARTSTTKEDAIAGWRGVFGPEFNL
jgi:hypothetical protein